MDIYEGIKKMGAHGWCTPITCDGMGVTENILYRSIEDIEEGNGKELEK